MKINWETLFGSTLMNRCQSPMVSLWKQVFYAALTLVLFSAGIPQAQAITLAPGTLLGMDNTNNRVLQYNSTGTLLDSLAVPGDNYVGITTIGSDLFVLSINTDNVYRIDLSTGSRSIAFHSATGSENMGRKGDNLLIAEHSTGLLNEYTTSGVLVNTINLDDGLTGIDSDGSRIFAGQYRNPNAGSIRIYDSLGNFQSTVGLGLPSRSISGMSYDAGADEFWVATGFGDDRIRRYSSGGALLDSFGAQSTWINGVTFIAIPEPSSLALGAIAVGGIVVSDRRRGRPGI